MSLPERTKMMPDAATLAMWSAAETGDLDKLARVLSRVGDIDARNEHGVTALMRAAQHGHLKIVRVLLEHGADANIKRNDKFTALALAAFFGHTAVVRALMEHGADSQASTRHGTSPQMWATARTFNEVANQLEKPAPVTPVIRPIARAVSRPVEAPPVRTQEQTRKAASAPVASAIVRTLKDPPEIWDLVHVQEVPKGFDAGSAFVGRLKSMKSGWPFRMAAAAVLICMCVVGAWVLRGVQARSERSSESSPKAPVAKISSASQNTKVEHHAEPAAVITTPPLENVPAAAPAAPAASDKELSAIPEKSGSRSTKVVSSHRVERSVTPRVAASEEVVQPVVTPTEKPAPPPVQPAPATKAKTNSPLSPQLISPVKSAPPKAKVIQWP